MSEKKETKITLTITLPTKEKIVETLQAIFPGITVEVKQEEKETAEAISDEEAEQIVEEPHIES
ncbi:unnamed protein product [marine sediment metagenome]|uniref:Uncharacterized protein n=1 Tax=marine sediment metagenome TaxID=412755 RepID=X1PKD0_9ZZZZ